MRLRNPHLIHAVSFLGFTPTIDIEPKYNDLVYTNEVLKIVSTYTPLGMDEAAPLADTAKHGCCRCLP